MIETDQLSDEIKVILQGQYSVQELKEAAVQYADHYAIPRDLFLGYLGAESNWDPGAKNPKSTATGLGQIIKATGERLGLRVTGGPDDERLDPGKNMDAIGREMDRLYGIYGDWKRVLLAIGEPHEEYYNRVKNRARLEMGMPLGERLPALTKRQPGLLETVKDYLGYKDLPEFLPVFNRDTGQWQKKTVYEARKLFHGWQEPTELERVMARGLSGLSLGTNPEVYGSRAQGAQGLARMLAAATILGGLQGTLLWPVITAAYRKVFGGNLEEDGKDWLAEDLGAGKWGSEKAMRFISRGLPAAALGIDIGSRIAPNLPFMHLPPGQLRWTEPLAALLGAGSIPVQRGFQMVRAYFEGDWSRFLEAAAPASMANLLAARRLGSEGATTLTGRPIFTAEGEPLALDLPEAVRKAIGFQPIRLSEHYARWRHAQAMERDRRDNLHTFAGRLARAIREQDEEAFNDTIDDCVEYNNRMVAAGRLADIISPGSLRRAVETRFRPKYPDVSEKKMRLRGWG